MHSRGGGLFPGPFSPLAENWTSDGPLYGNRWEFFVDVTGDRKADVVLDNWDGLAVRHALNDRFPGLNANGQLIIGGDFPRRQWGYWTEKEFVGNNGGTGFADVDGDGDSEPIRNLAGDYLLELTEECEVALQGQQPFPPVP